jgi:tetratricopeptide (TPR) repeat protein
MKMNFVKGLYILAILGMVSIVCGSDVKTSSERNKDQDMFEKSRQVKKQLLQSNISPVAESTISETKNELFDLIDQLQALELPGTYEETEVFEPSIVEIPNEEVQEASEQSTTPEKPQDKETTTIQDNKGDKDIVSLLEGAENIVNPLAAADCLYAHDEYKTAAQLYQVALKQMVDTKEALFRPWALFQAGNCLRRTEPDTAYKFYEQLISEYPESYWTPAARSEQQIIDWFKTNQSFVNMERYGSDPNSL